MCEGVPPRSAYTNLKEAALATHAHVSDAAAAVLRTLGVRLSWGRIIDDAVAYIDSIGQDCGLAGWSGGASLALAAAAQSDALTAVAPFEPGILSLADEQDQAHIGQAGARMGELAAHGDLRLRLAPSLAFPSTTRR